MFEKIVINNITPLAKSKSKKLIVLCNSFRNYVDYVNSLKYRNNGKYSKIPHYLITRDGKIFNFLDNLEYSALLSSESLNRNSIIIVLENYGWLEKIPLTNHYLNWIGNIYKEEVHERKWRDYFFWHPYTTEQIEKCVELCNHLTDELNINKKCIGHNTKVDGIENFSGIISKSNIHEDYTDLSPAFDFKLFELKLKNDEQQSI